MQTTGNQTFTSKICNKKYQKHSENTRNLLRVYNSSAQLKKNP